VRAPAARPACNWLTVANVNPHAPAASWRSNTCGDIVVLPCGAKRTPTADRRRAPAPCGQPLNAASRTGSRGGSVIADCPARRRWGQRRARSASRRPGGTGRQAKSYGPPFSSARW
jgi:hypothetical protein